MPIRLREAIKECEAIYVAQIKDEIFTHERLIGAIAGQMGGAHEAEGLDHKLVILNQILINHRQLYVDILMFDAELTLQIGERVLDFAEANCGYKRTSRSREYGDISILMRFSRRDVIIKRTPLVTFNSSISEAKVTVCADPRSTLFTMEKRGKTVVELETPYPLEWPVNDDAAFAMSYSSQQQARVITNGTTIGKPVPCSVAWLDARELGHPELHKDSEAVISMQFIPVYRRLLSPRECGDLLELSPDLREMREPEPPTDGAFPT